METRAPYALIGLFVLAAIGAVFGFVYWLHNSGGLSERTVYRVRFENTVSGLLKGAAVLFNGIRVGEVTDLQLDTDNPRQITATIADGGTPVRADTCRIGFPGPDRSSGDHAPRRHRVDAWATSSGECGFSLPTPRPVRA